MKLSNVTVAAAAACPPICVSAYPKLLIAGSTTVAPTFQDAFVGWGAYIAPLLNVSVMNQAVAQSSLRNTYNSPAWARTLGLVSAGDFVVLEYGLDDEGDPRAPASKNGSVNLRPSLPGTGDETVTLKYDILQSRVLPNGTIVGIKGTNTTKTEVVHTFGWYLKNMIVDIRDKSGHPIISSLIPKNWNTTTTGVGNATTDILPTDYKFRDYAQQVAEELKVDFVDHTYYTLRYLQDLGPVASKKLYGFSKSGRNGKNLVTDAFTSKAGGKGMLYPIPSLLVTIVALLTIVL
jgi:rhamnogalacturonan acetylesterase